MKRNSALIILGILFGLNALAWLAVWDLSKGAELLEVTFFDIGQGDAIFIETPQRYQILIDGGPDSTILEKLGDEMPFWDRTIDLIILTHPEHDHIFGLIEVLKRYKVENILWTGVLRDTAEYEEWIKSIAEEEAKIYIAKSGLRIFGDSTSRGRSNLDILYPFEGLEGETVSNTNNTSVIARLVFGKTSFLFTGDIYKSVERELIKENTYIESDVLKVAHHGSKTSSAPEFIEAVSPEIAVIQAGVDNSYGHPSPETLEILEKYDITIFRTDINGDIKIISNGDDFSNP